MRANVDKVSVSRASKRLLDPIPWGVTSIDADSGACIIQRGAIPSPAQDDDCPDEILQGFEGAPRRAFVTHRKREARMRAAKLAQARALNRGRLLCEVPRCGFEFSSRYGDTGDGYIQVHHLEPLSDAPDTGRPIRLDKLAVVCANCHVMIHRGGQCRELGSLIPE